MNDEQPDAQIQKDEQKSGGRSLLRKLTTHRGNKKSPKDKNALKLLNNNINRAPIDRYIDSFWLLNCPEKYSVW